MGGAARTCTPHFQLKRGSKGSTAQFHRKGDNRCTIAHQAPCAHDLRKSAAYNRNLVGSGPGLLLDNAPVHNRFDIHYRNHIPTWCLPCTRTPKKGRVTKQNRVGKDTFPITPLRGSSSSIHPIRPSANPNRAQPHRPKAVALAYIPLCMRQRSTATAWHASPQPRPQPGGLLRHSTHSTHHAMPCYASHPLHSYLDSPDIWPLTHPQGSSPSTATAKPPAAIACTGPGPGPGAARSRAWPHLTPPPPRLHKPRLSTYDPDLLGAGINGKGMVISRRRPRRATLALLLGLLPQLRMLAGDEMGGAKDPR